MVELEERPREPSKEPSKEPPKEPPKEPWKRPPRALSKELLTGELRVLLGLVGLVGEPPEGFAEPVGPTYLWELVQCSQSKLLMLPLEPLVFDCRIFYPPRLAPPVSPLPSCPHLVAQAQARSSNNT